MQPNQGHSRSWKTVFKTLAHKMLTDFLTGAEDFNIFLNMRVSIFDIDLFIAAVSG